MTHEIIGAFISFSPFNSIRALFTLFTPYNTIKMSSLHSIIHYIPGIKGLII